jgi:hypothetical protein
MKLHPISLHVVGGVRPRAQHAGFSRERNSPAAASSILISTLTLAYINKASLHTREEKKKGKERTPPDCCYSLPSIHAEEAKASVTHPFASESNTEENGCCTRRRIPSLDHPLW